MLEDAVGTKRVVRHCGMFGGVFSGVVVLCRRCVSCNLVGCFFEAS